MENQQQPPQTTLCRSGCGFFGAASTEGLCSKCYKDQIKRTQDTTTNAARISPTLSVPVPMASSSSSSVPSSSSISAPMEPLDSSPSPVSPLVTSLSPSSSAEKTMTCSQAAFSTEEQVAKLESAAAAAEGVAAVAATLSTSSSLASLDSAVPSPSADVGPPAKKVNRCGHCKKRVGLTGFPCRCGGLFCSDHRYDTAHACSFDYKTMEREQIAKNNPVVVSDKIQRI